MDFVRFLKPLKDYSYPGYTDWNDKDTNLR